MVNQFSYIQPNVKDVKFHSQTSVINFYKDHAPNLTPLYLPKIEELKDAPSSDMFVKSNTKAVDEATKRNNDILAQFDSDSDSDSDCEHQYYNFPRTQKTNILKELNKINKKWKAQVETSKNERILHEADMHSEEIYVNPRRLSLPFSI